MTHYDEAIDIERICRHQTGRTMRELTRLAVANGVNPELERVIAERQSTRRPGHHIALGLRSGTRVARHGDRRVVDCHCAASASD